MDVSILRDFHVKEEHQLKFRSEPLSFLIRPNFANPNITRRNAALGRITSLAPGNQHRIIQIGLR